MLRCGRSGRPCLAVVLAHAVAHPSSQSACISRKFRQARVKSVEHLLKGLDAVDVNGRHFSTAVPLVPTFVSII
jgi:hypothetical protein